MKASDWGETTILGTVINLVVFDELLLSTTFQPNESVRRAFKPHFESVISREESLISRGTSTNAEWPGYLARDLSADGEAVSDNWFFVGSFAVPTVQLHAATTTQQHLTVDFYRRLAGELMTCTCIDTHTHTHTDTYKVEQKKTGATQSHCKYSENSTTELRGNWWTSAILYAEHSH